MSYIIKYSFKKVLLAHHPKLQIIVTIGEDQNLLFWDTDASGGGNRLLFSKNLGYTVMPTAIRFTKDGEYLIVGFSDGLLIWLDSRIGKSLQGKTDEKFLMPGLGLIKKQKAEENNAVLNIELSDSGQNLAVSYNYKITQTKDKKPLLSNSFISLFNNKSRQKTKNFSKLDSGRIFQKFTSIMCPYSESVYKTQKSNQYGMAAYSMAFAQGQGKFYLLIYYQLVDSCQNRLNFSTEGKYSVWDVSTSTMVANLDLVGSLSWKKLCLQNSIFSKYMFWKNLVDYKGNQGQQQQPINNNLYIPRMSVLATIPNHLIMGSVNGDLHIVKSSALQFDGANPQEKDMFIAKTYPAHCSELNQIEVNPDKVYIYTTSTLDQCIFKYRIQGSTKLTVQEQLLYEDITSDDIFNQIPTTQHQQSMLAIYQSKENLQPRKWLDTQNFLQRISIVQIIGRRASTLRQNIFIDTGYRIIYHIGQVIVNWNPQTKQKKFICSSSTDDRQLNQITQLHISHDNRSVVAAHSGVDKVDVVMWENNSKSVLKQFFVNGITHVILMKLNHDDSRIVVYGVDKKNNAQLVLIDFITYKPLAVVSYAHKPAWSIKAIHFAQLSQNIFYTSGVQETKIWTFTGNQLTYQEIPADTTSIQKIIHLSMLVINKTLVTGGDDGSVYAWKSQLIKKQGHDSMVTCLAKDRQQSGNLFYSGGKDGNILLWMLQINALIIMKKVSILDTLTPLQKHTTMTLNQPSFNHQIQTINVFRQQIVIGTRNGNIYQTSYEQMNALHDQKPIRELFAFHDFQKVQALFFNPEETELYEISKEGLFSIWLIKDSKLLHSHAFKEETIDMGYHSRTSTIFIAFKKQLRVFYIQKEQSTTKILTNQKLDQNQSQQPQPKLPSYKLRQLPQLSVAIKHITHMTFSNNEKMLALGIESNSDKSISIDIYEVPQDMRSARIQLKKLFKISLMSSISFIDFSLNNKFLLICLMDGVIIRDLAEMKNVNQELISKIEWCSRGVIYGRQSQVTLEQWVETWGGVRSKKNQKSKLKETTKDLSMSKMQGRKKNLQQIGEKKEKLSLQRKSISKKPYVQTISPQLHHLTVSRLQSQKFLLVEKQGSIFIYHQQNMLSKLTLPLTCINHYTVSVNKKYIALACQLDRMVVIVNISKCLLKGNASNN